MSLPSSLQSLTFGWELSRRLGQLAWQGQVIRGDETVEVGFELLSQSGLEISECVMYFSKSLEQGFLFRGLQSLTIGDVGDIGEYTRDLGRVILPRGLQSLTFGEYFNQRLDGMIWPDSLESLTFGESFNQSLDQLSLPKALRILTFGDGFNQIKPGSGALAEQA